MIRKPNTKCVEYFFSCFVVCVFLRIPVELCALQFGLFFVPQRLFISIAAELHLYNNLLTQSLGF